MKILYYSTSYTAQHGGSIQSIELYSELKKSDSVTELALYPPKRQSTPIYRNKETSLLRRILKKIPVLQVVFFYRRNSFYLRGLQKIITGFRPDVLLMQIDSNFLQIKYLKQKFPNLLICTQINGSPFDEPFKNIAFKKWFLKQQLKAYQRADLNIFVSDFSRKRIMGEKLDPVRDVVVFNGTDTDKFFPIGEKKELRSKLEYPVDDFILGYIGTLDFHKQLGLLIEVFKKLLEDQKDLRLVIIGDGPAYPKLSQKIEQMRLGHKIELRGWVKHEEINEHLNCFDIAVHHYASNYMNPLKIFEYLSAGLPVIAPDIPSVRETFRHGEDLLITGSSKNDLELNLKKLIGDSQLRNRLSNNHHLVKATEEEYTWRRYADRILEKISSHLNK